MTDSAAGPPFHPLYRELHAEPLRRPYPVVAGQVMVSHRAVLFAPEEAAAHAAWLADLPGAAGSPEENGVQILQLGGVELRIERHGEFTAFTALAPQAGPPFARSAADLLPADLLRGVPGQILVAVEIAGELVAAADAGTARTMERVLDFFDQQRVAGGWVVERMASVWSHFQPDERGATRFLVQIHRLPSGRYGRLLQRLVEIENARMAALLGLPLAREIVSRTGELETRHAALLGRLAAGKPDPAAARELAELAAATAQLRLRGGPRFRRTAAYAGELTARLAELREEQVPGYQTLGELFARRLPRAWAECASAGEELALFSARLDATAASLRTPAASPSRLRHTAEGFLLAAAVLGLVAFFAPAWQPYPLANALVMGLCASAAWWLARARRT